MNKNKKIIIAICISIVVLIIALIVIFQISRNQRQKEEIRNTVNSYTSPEQFKTAEEVATYLECDFIKQEESKSKNYMVDIYIKIKYLPYTDDQSNEVFYNRLISYMAKVINYNNFRIIDKSNDIFIEVICNNETRKIKNKIINGENNYFAKHDSYIEISKIKDTKETEFNIESDILKNIISNNWQIPNKNIGLQESTFELYDIYFDEGIEIRKINNKVFNIIFTKNYIPNIVNNINTKLSKDQIINILGSPTFEYDKYDLLGYKGKDFYLFYNNTGEISIYKVEKEGKDFSKYIDEFIDDKDYEKLIKSIKNEYQDFDKYKKDQSGQILQYSADGIKFNFQKENNIEIYNNYIGSIFNNKKISDLQDVELPDNIIVKNENLIYKAEIERIKKIEQFKKEETTDENSVKSNSFYLLKTLISDGTYKIKFISKDGKNPNCELKENIDTCLWISDTKFLYSIKNNGIYLYDLETRKYRTLITGTENFKLIKYENQVLKYDEKNIKVN